MWKWYDSAVYGTGVVALVIVAFLLVMFVVTHVSDFIKTVYEMKPENKYLRHRVRLLEEEREVAHALRKTLEEQRDQLESEVAELRKAIGYRDEASGCENRPTGEALS